MEEDKKEKTKVVFSIKQGALAEDKPHPFHAVLAGFQNKTLLTSSSDQEDIKPHFHQRNAYPVHALISGKVVGDGNNYTFQCDLYLSANVVKIIQVLVLVMR